MKKLMVAAAIVFAAVTSQAAIVKWSTTNQVKLNGTVLTDLPVTLMIVGVNEASNLDIDLRNTSTSSLGPGKLGSNYSSAQTQKYTDTVAGGPVWDSEAGDLGREYYILMQAEQGGKTYTYQSSLKASSGLTNKAQGTVAFTINDVIGEAGDLDKWVLQSSPEPTPTPTPTPEPTSGLLLLLGVAGLALRRKQK